MGRSALKPHFQAAPPLPSASHSHRHASKHNESKKPCVATDQCAVTHRPGEGPGWLLSHGEDDLCGAPVEAA